MTHEEEIKKILDKCNNDPIKLAEEIIFLKDSLLEANEQNDLL